MPLKAEENILYSLAGQVFSMTIPNYGRETMMLVNICSSQFPYASYIIVSGCVYGTYFAAGVIYHMY